ncbi:protein arginine N-methyltransferase 1.6 isoform X1 [Senna tora]|uniref:Protein arginine N-methyltransferase 1.6 isoform X1 n=1 Tax=Senna tora TaxID=362788 RepID=A0A834WAK9_9FABA|nr:protein arginine N-methyltransferase 1.6 isoform X1 [Senna tora]
MGLPLVALLQCIIAHHSLNPAVLAGFACPLPLKLFLGFRIFREACCDAIDASRLFFFRLGHIAFDPHPIAANDDDDDARLERAFRLICRTISNPRPQEVPEIPIETMRAFSMVVL